MTVRQVIETALRELGFTEDQVKDRINYATAMTGGSAKALIEKPVIAGKEREIIDQYKSLFHITQANPLLAMEMIKTLEGSMRKNN